MDKDYNMSDENQAKNVPFIEADIDDTIQNEFLRVFNEIKSKNQAEEKVPQNDFKWIEGGNAFKDIRNKIGLNQKDFAKLLGVSTTTMSFWEVGKYRPRFQSLIGIKYQLMDFGQQIGIPDLAEQLQFEKFGFTKRG